DAGLARETRLGPNLIGNGGFGGRRSGRARTGLAAGRPAVERRRVTTRGGAAAGILAHEAGQFGDQVVGTLARALGPRRSACVHEARSSISRAPGSLRPKCGPRSAVVTDTSMCLNYESSSGALTPRSPRPLSS